MTSQTIPLFFKVSPELLQKNAIDCLLNDIGKICLDDVASRHDVDIGNGDKVVTMVSKNTSHLTMRVYRARGLVTIEIHFLCEGENQESSQDLEEVRQRYKVKGEGETWEEFAINKLEGGIRTYLGNRCIQVETFYCPIRRGGALWQYVTTCSGHLREMDYDKILYSSFSKMQRIEVYHSPRLHGNCLIQDGVMMFSEGDNPYYSDLLLGIGKEKRNEFEGKDVLLLGGGGGSILNCLMAEKPNMVVMCEIDGEVIEVSRKYMRKGCGDCLDEMEGPHHKILIEDGFKVLKDAIQDGRKFDYVVDEMTTIDIVPESNDGNSKSRDGRDPISCFSLIKQVLKPGGICFVSYDASPVQRYTNFEKAAKAAGGTFVRREAVCIPSWLENFFFYEVTFP